MFSKKFFMFSAMILLLVAVFFVATTATANDMACGRGTFEAANGLIFKKDVYCSMERDWKWTILKSVDQSSLQLSTGQSILVNYIITASAQAVESSFDVGGNIVFVNTSNEPIVITSVSDLLGPDTCPDQPFTVEPGATVSCTYSSSSLATKPDQNEASAVDSNGVVYTVTAPIDWSKATVKGETDECATISDSFAGTLGTVCAGDAPKTFTYSRLIGPYNLCGDYTVENIALFVTNDTGASGSDNAMVDVNVPCEGGCSLTPGYWKTHSGYGPAPYDDTWAQIGEDTLFFFSGKSYYQALWTAPQGNAYWILAHAYIAAQLNQLNGADFTAAQAAFADATVLFNNPANTPAAVGALRGSARNTWINLATILDNYNNGLIGPGHCSE